MCIYIYMWLLGYFAKAIFGKRALVPWSRAVCCSMEVPPSGVQGQKSAGMEVPPIVVQGQNWSANGLQAVLALAQ